MAAKMASRESPKQQVKEALSYGYFLYEGGRSHWQCGNIFAGDSLGYPITEEDHKKPLEAKNEMYKAQKAIEAEAEQKKKEEEKAKQVAAEKK